MLSGDACTGIAHPDFHEMFRNAGTGKNDLPSGRSMLESVSEEVADCAPEKVAFRMNRPFSADYDLDALLFSHCPEQFVNPCQFSWHVQRYFFDPDLVVCCAGKKEKAFNHTGKSAVFLKA